MTTIIDKFTATNYSANAATLSVNLVAPLDNPGNAKALDVDCGPRYMKIQDRELNEIEGMVSHSWYLEDKVWYDDLA